MQRGAAEGKGGGSSCLVELTFEKDRRAMLNPHRGKYNAVIRETEEDQNGSAERVSHTLDKSEAVFPCSPPEKTG